MVEWKFFSRRRILREPSCFNAYKERPHLGTSKNIPTPLELFRLFGFQSSNQPTIGSGRDLRVRRGASKAPNSFGRIDFIDSQAPDSLDKTKALRRAPLLLRRPPQSGAEADCA